MTVLATIITLLSILLLAQSLLALVSGFGMLVLVPLVLAFGGRGGAGGGLSRGGSGPVWRDGGLLRSVR